MQSTDYMDKYFLNFSGNQLPVNKSCFSLSALLPPSKPKFNNTTTLAIKSTKNRKRVWGNILNTMKTKTGQHDLWRKVLVEQTDFPIYSYKNRKTEPQI